MSKKSYRQAINEALRQEMERDPRVILMGEDVAGGMGAPGEDDAWGGPLGVTKGLEPIFGRDRVLIRRSPRAPSSARQRARRRPVCARSPS
jgi:pyruvate/2-oxoglutarate/acetoin dehydrogenase E1 component